MFEHKKYQDVKHMHFYFFLWEVANVFRQQV